MLLNKCPNNLWGGVNTEYDPQMQPNYFNVVGKTPLKGFSHY